jgi:hypothetical protein
MIRRLGWIGIGGIALLGAACGGTVLGSDGKGTPSDDLHTNGAERCKAACAKIVSCGGTGSQSCDCSCPPCPVGATSCDCPPCACTREAQAPAKCESDCNDAVQQVLAQTPDCGAPMLALLGCLAAAPCQVAGAEPCKAEQDARQICDDAHHGNTPPRGDPVQDPGASGGPGISPGPGSSAGNVGPAAPGVGVTCTSGFAGSADGPQEPGALVCQQGWGNCSDYRNYDIDCTATAASTLLICTCLVNGLAESSFETDRCPDSTGGANALCGWHLR